MGAGLPKQFLMLQDKPVLVHTLQRFLDYDDALRIALVMHEGSFGLWEATAGQYLSDEARGRIVLAPGGAERTASVHNGLEALAAQVAAPQQCLVAIHDAVRPFVSREMLDAAFETARLHGASVCCVPVKSSLRERLPGGASRAVDRSLFLHVQTPQTFSLALLLEAFRRRPHDRYTDDASLYEALAGPVQLCEGSYENIKITTPEDLYVAQQLLSAGH